MRFLIQCADKYKYYPVYQMELTPKNKPIFPILRYETKDAAAQDQVLKTADRHMRIVDAQSWVVLFRKKRDGSPKQSSVSSTEDS